MSDPKEAGQAHGTSKEPIPADQVMWHCRTCGSLDTQAWKRPPNGEIERLRAYIRQDAIEIDCLIAVRAELLAALEMLVTDLRDYPAWQRPCAALDQAETAIAKAKRGTT